jgi:putative transposase
MNFNPNIHHQRSIRMKDYDYSSPGVDFITMVTMERVNLYGEIIDGEMRLNSLGEIICAA